MNLTLVIGLPGSGKSTLIKHLSESYYALTGKRKYVVSRDSLREMLQPQAYTFDPIMEKIVHKINIDAIKSLAIAGEDIIIDETNLVSHRRLEIVNNIIGTRANLQSVTYKEFTNHDIEYLLDRRMYNCRDLSRDYWEKVIIKLKDIYQPVKQEELDFFETYRIRFTHTKYEGLE